MPDAMISTLDTDALSQAIPWQWFEQAIVESPSHVGLGRANAIANAESYHSGLLFGPLAELRWKHLRGGKFRLVCVHDSGRALDNAQDKHALTHCGRDQIVLWGDPQSGTEEPVWYEPRVPRRITEYPTELRGKRVYVRIHRYRFDNAAEQSSRYCYRCVHLIGVENEAREL